MKANLFTALLAIMLGVLTGWGVAQAASLHAQQTTTGNSQLASGIFDSQVATFRVEFNTLLHEHTVMAGEMVTALYEEKDTSRLTKLMEENQNALAEKVENVYDAETRDRFSDLWTQHIEEYERYTTAKKENDTQAMNEAKENLEKISNDFGELFENAGENLSASTVSSLMREHVSGTLAVVNAVAEDDTTKKANEMKEAYDQAGEFADTLSRGMILDNPNAFNN